jgi:hydrogenase expression/formation protein HypE
MPPLPVGKLRAELLERLFGKYVAASARVVVGPRVGEDAAVLDVGDHYLVATTDPITFASDEIAWYALHVNANDLAVRGARPLWFLATLLLPESGTSEARVEDLFAELGEACAELDVALVGGHTEVTAGLPRPIVVGCMLGEVDKARLVTTGGACEGDVLLLTKGVPLEGAAIVAREHGAEAQRRGVPADVVARARDLLRRPGISVLPESRLACGAARVHAMHDPTEGGVATACWELARAADVGVRVHREQIPVLNEGRMLCEAFGLDPLGTIASGSLLLSVATADANAVVGACRGAGIACAAIGEVTAASRGVTLVSAGHERPMPSFAQDEITKVFNPLRSGADPRGDGAAVGH